MLHVSCHTIGERALRQLLSYTHAPSADLRSLSIRLVVNKLYGDTTLLKPILDYARALMARVTDPVTLEDIPEITVPPMPTEVPTWAVFKEQEKAKYEKAIADAKAQAEAAKAQTDATATTTESTTTAVETSDATACSTDGIKVKVEPTTDATPTSISSDTPSLELLDETRLKELETKWKKEHERLMLRRHIMIRERELIERESKERNKIRQDRIGRYLELFFAIATKQQPLLGMVCTLYARANAFVRSVIQKQVSLIV